MARIYSLRGNRLPNAYRQIKSEIPDGLEPIMGPIGTGLGEIYFYTVEAEEGALKKTAQNIRRWIFSQSKTGLLCHSFAILKAL